MLRTRTDFIVVHCSATKARTDIGRKEIHGWHVTRGWARIGYHKVIRRDGTVEDGRGLDEIGAHVAGYNNRSIGICLVGGLDEDGKPENNFTEAQFEALGSLLHRMKERYPKAEVLGHRDLSPDQNHDGKIERWEWLKDCPCFDVRAWWSLLQE